MTELTDTERARGHVGIPTTRGRWYSEAQVEAILTARLARVEALAEEWEATPDADLGMSQPYAADALRAVLASDWLAAHDAAIRAEALRDATGALAIVRAEALEEYADELTWVQPEVSPCAPNFESCCGSEDSCDAMSPSVSVVGAASLRARAAALRAAQPTEGES